MSSRTSTGGVAAGRRQTCPGAYTFRLEAQQNTSAVGTAIAEVWYSVITATYYPTAYGSVASVVEQGDIDSFREAVSVSTGPADPGTSAASGTTFTVDLRELELRAAKLRAEAQAAELELLKARMAEQERQAAGSEGTPER